MEKSLSYQLDNNFIIALYKTSWNSIKFYLMSMIANLHPRGRMSASPVANLAQARKLQTASYVHFYQVCLDIVVVPSS